MQVPNIAGDLWGFYGDSMEIVGSRSPYNPLWALGGDSSEALPWIQEWQAM